MSWLAEGYNGDPRKPGRRRRPAARDAFEGLSHTHRREYVEWIAGAKRAETRSRRLDQAIVMLREGRHR